MHLNAWKACVITAAHRVPASAFENLAKQLVNMVSLPLHLSMLIFLCGWLITFFRCRIKLAQGCSRQPCSLRH
eukprot:5716988-Amphidinium_carterae.1